MSTNLRSSLPILILVLVGGLLAACTSVASGGSSQAPVSPSAPAAADDVTITVETSGGMCIDGACGSTVEIAPDGTVTQTAPNETELGTLSESTLDALITEVEQADFEAIQSQPFTDTCPIAFDGQQFVYTFTVGADTVKIDSCEVVVDPENPLFVAVNAALAEVAPS
jgi:hypothetical protein